MSLENTLTCPKLWIISFHLQCLHILEYFFHSNFSSSGSTSLSVFVCYNTLITFCVRHSWGKMYIGYGCLCVCLSMCLSVWPSPHSHTTARTRMQLAGMAGVPLVVHYWANLQSVHGFRCYDNIHICKLIALHTANAYRAERDMSASACTLSMAHCTFFSGRTLLWDLAFRI